jgi:hypothetical protein
MLDVVGDHDILTDDASTDGADEGSTDDEGDNDGWDVDEGTDESVGTGDLEGKEDGHPSPNKAEVSLKPKSPPSTRSWFSYKILYLPSPYLQQIPSPAESKIVNW